MLQSKMHYVDFQKSSSHSVVIYIYNLNFMKRTLKNLLQWLDYYVLYTLIYVHITLVEKLELRAKREFFFPKVLVFFFLFFLVDN